MFVFIRDVIAEKMYQSSQRYMIGGLGLAVEIDESMHCNVLYVYELILDVNLLFDREIFIKLCH